MQTVKAIVKERAKLEHILDMIEIEINGLETNPGIQNIETVRIAYIDLLNKLNKILEDTSPEMLPNLYDNMQTSGDEHILESGGAAVMKAQENVEKALADSPKRRASGIGAMLYSSLSKFVPATRRLSTSSKIENKNSPGPQ